MRILVIDNQATKPEYVYELEDSIMVNDVIYTNDTNYGLELLENQTFDALILELVLSGTDGYEILQKVRSNPDHQQMKVFIVSHLFSDGGIQKAFQLGADHYMIKPVNAVVLLARITEINKKYRWVEAPVLPTTKISDPIDLDTYIPELLRQLGTPPRLKGYRYLVSALTLAIKHPEVFDQGITKVVYPTIAKEFYTTPSRVERAIRHAVEKTWDNGLTDILEKVFGNTVSSAKGKPTNSEFILAVCEYVRVTKKSSQPVQ